MPPRASMGSLSLMQVGCCLGMIHCVAGNQPCSSANCLVKMHARCYMHMLMQPSACSWGCIMQHTVQRNMYAQEHTSLKLG